MLNHVKLIFKIQSSQTVCPFFIIKSTWVCLKIGYTPNYSHLIGIMISKTIGSRGTNHFQTNPHLSSSLKVALMARSRRFIWLMKRSRKTPEQLQTTYRESCCAAERRGSIGPKKGIKKVDHHIHNLPV